MSLAKKMKWGFGSYMLGYFAIMIVAVVILFISFPTIPELFEFIYPNSMIRMVILGAIILVLPVAVIFSMINKGASGMWILFDFPTKKYNKTSIARLYFMVAVGLFVILLFAVLLIKGMFLQSGYME